MSKKFYDRLLTGSGVSSKQVQSEFGSKILSKFGWKEGDGLGSDRQGMKECIQLTRRDENAGLGKDSSANPADEWGDWWTDSFNSIAKQISAKNPKKRLRSNSSTSSSDSSSSSSCSDSESSDSSSSSDSSAGPRYSAIKKAGVQRGKLGRVARQDAAFAAKRPNK